MAPIGNDESNSWRGRLFAAAVSRGGGCGRSRAVEVAFERPDADLGEDSVVVFVGLVVLSMIEGALSSGSNLAYSGSFESTISVVDVVLLPKRLIFFARAAREERRRSRTPGRGGRFVSSS